MRYSVRFFSSKFCFVSFMGLLCSFLFSGFVYGMNNKRIDSLERQIERVKKQLESEKSIKNKQLKKLDKKKRLYCSFLKKLIRERPDKPRCEFADGFFGQLGNKDFYRYGFGKESFLEHKKTEKRIYFSRARDDLIIVQLPVPQQKGLQCESNSAFYSQSMAVLTYQKWLDKYYYSTEPTSAAACIKRRVDKVGENATTAERMRKEEQEGFLSKAFKPNGLDVYRTIIDIDPRIGRGGKVLRTSEDEIKNSCWEHYYRSDPRLRFTITGQPETFAGGITQDHAIAWRLEKVSSSADEKGKYIIFFCDSYYSKNMIEKYKGTFIEFLDAMLIKTGGFFEFLQKGDKMIHSYLGA